MGVKETCVVRSARSSDARAITHFNVRLAWETEHQQLDPITVQAGVEAVLGDRAKGEYFVAEANDQVVGQCSVTYEWSDWRNGMYWWLQSVYVDGPWRQRGTFRDLFEHVRRTAHSAGAVGLRLYVAKTNLVAQAVYQRRGMVRAGYEVFEVMLKPGPRG